MGSTLGEPSGCRVARSPLDALGGEHADRDHAHIGGFGMRQQIAEIMRRVARRDNRSGAGVEQSCSRAWAVSNTRASTTW